MYELVCVECGSVFEYKEQPYDDSRCVYCHGQLAVREKRVQQRAKQVAKKRNPKVSIKRK